MRREARIGMLAFLLSFSISFAASSFSVNHSIESRVQKHPRPALDVSDVTYPPGSEIVTGMCTFGDCPVIMPATEQETTTEPETQSKTEQIAKNVQIEADYTPKNVQATGTDAVAYETGGGYIGRMYVTGYTAEEGFYEGSPTASGVGAGPGTCAMNNSQRQSLGIKYGEQIYVEGLGTYTVTNCGCDWDVVDIWLYTNAEAYAITGYYNVYYS